jgi:hypothetical protein
MPTWRPSPRTGRRGIRQSGKRAHWPRRCSTPGTTSCCIAHWRHCGWMSGPSTRSTGSAGQARARTSRTAAAVFSPRTSSSARYPVWATVPHRPANERLDQMRPMLTRLTPASASSATRKVTQITRSQTAELRKNWNEVDSWHGGNPRR